MSHVNQRGEWEERGGGSNDRALKMLNIALAYEFLKSILSKS